MSSTSSSKPTIAIFGCTGGTGLSVLKHSLSAGHPVNVLARTPSKLSGLSAQYPDLLHITAGNIHSVPDVRETLLRDNRPVDIVVSAIGMIPQRHGLKLSGDDPTVCEVGTQNLLTALGELESKAESHVSNGRPEAAASTHGEPLLVLLSSTGVSMQARDIPLPVVPLYHWLGAVPHADKRKMEEVVRASGRRRWVMVRPSLLLDGPAKGLRSVRTGVEVPGDKEQGAPAVGYTIRREDVGGWISEECVKEDSARWEGKCVSLTY